MPRGGNSTTRGYGYKDHQLPRKTVEIDVQAGNAYCAELICLMPDRWINPDEPWDYAHDRINGGYLGPSHRACNRSEGAVYGNHLRSQPDGTPSNAW